jgi:hypothetical protein
MTCSGAMRATNTHRPLIRSQEIRLMIAPSREIVMDQRGAVCRLMVRFAA